MCIAAGVVCYRLYFFLFASEDKMQKVVIYSVLTYCSLG